MPPFEFEATCPEESGFRKLRFSIVDFRPTHSLTLSTSIRFVASRRKTGFTENWVQVSHDSLSDGQMNDSYIEEPRISGAHTTNEKPVFGSANTGN